MTTNVSMSDQVRVVTSLVASTSLVYGESFYSADYKSAQQELSKVRQEGDTWEMSEVLSACDGQVEQVTDPEEVEV